jgi:hypothetical protein
MRSLKRLLVGVLATSLASVGLVLAPVGQKPAHAADLYFGEDYTSYTSYGPNEEVTISGDMYGGCIDEFGQFASDVYVVPHGSMDPSAPATMSGQPNAVVTSSLTGGYFLDETIGFTGPAGKLGTGDYDVVMDTCAEGKYVPGRDVILGAGTGTGAFSVDVNGTVPGMPAADIAALKTSAAAQAASWRKGAKAYAALFLVFELTNVMGGLEDQLVNFYLDYLCSAHETEFGFDKYCPTVGPADRIKIYLTVLKQMLDQSAHWNAIANDPPDPNYTVPAVADAAPTIQPDSGDPVETGVAALGTQSGAESGLVDALLQSMQRYQGAQQAGDTVAALSQAESVQRYASLVAAAVPTSSARAADVAAAVAQSGVDVAGTSAKLVALRQRLAGSGFTADETAGLAAAGLTPTQVANLRTVLTESSATDAGADFTLDSYATYGSPADFASSLSGLTANTRQAAAQLAADMPGVISTLKSQITAPGDLTPSAGGPYTGTVGVPVSFDATASTTPAGAGPLSYAWDLTGSGTFTDATGATPQFTFSQPRSGLVGVRVTNAAGASATTYAPIAVAAVAPLPAISAETPGPGPTTITPGTAQTFSASATDASGSALTYTWTLDGTQISTAPTFTRTFGTADVGLHDVGLAVTGPGGTASQQTQILVSPPPHTLTGLSVLPAAPSLRVGSSLQLSATGAFSDGGTADQTGAVTWTSSAPGVAGVTSGGLVTAGSQGAATITATSGAVTAPTTVTVTPQPATLTAVTIDPVNPTVTVGSGEQFHATGTYSDGTTADLTGTAAWSSANSGIATIGSDGHAATVAPGTAAIQATAGGQSATTRLTVVSAGAVPTAVTVAPATPVLTLGGHQQMTATEHFSDGHVVDVTSSAVWSSSTAGVATVSSTGLVQAGSTAGSAVISAAQDGLTGSTTVTVGVAGGLGAATYFVTERGNEGVAKVTVDAAGTATVQPNFVTGLPPNGPDSLLFDHHGNIVVANTDRGTLSLADPKTGAVVTPTINNQNLGLVADLALDPNSDTVWSIQYNGNGPNAIAATSLTTGAVRFANPSGLNGIGGIAFNADGTRLFVDDLNGGVSEISPVDGHLVRSLAIGSHNDGMTFDPATGDLFVADMYLSGLREIGIGTDAAPTLAAVRSLPGPSVDGIAADGHGHVIAVQPGCCLVAFDILSGKVSPVASGIPSADDVAPVAGAGAPGPGATTLLQTSPAQAGFDDPVTLAATLTQADAPVVGVPVTLTAGNQSCVAVTAANGAAACSIQLAQPPGQIPTTAVFAGNADAAASLASGTLTIVPEEDTLAYTGTGQFVDGSSATLTAMLAEDGVTPIPGQPVVLALGSGSSAQTCQATTDGSGLAACTIAAVSQPAGAGAVTASFAGSTSYVPATATHQVSILVPTRIAVAGGTVAEHDDAVTLIAQLSDLSTSPESPLGGAPVTLRLGGESCQATTGSDGQASCSVTPEENAGPTTVQASYAGDGSHLAATVSVPGSIALEETQVTYTGETLFAAGGTAHLSGHLVTDGTEALPGKTLTLSVGSGASAQSCTAVTDAHGDAACTVSGVQQPLGPVTATAAFAGDPAFAAAVQSAAGLAYAFSGGGSFVIGDRSATAGRSVTFWGAQWAKDNSLSGGSAPNAFKGFADQAANPPQVGQTWSSDPGNSSEPPDTVPSELGVIVAGQVGKSGPTVSGNVVGIAIVCTNPGYGPAPGHAGTGTVVAFLPLAASAGHGPLLPFLTPGQSGCKG